ncbi:hypothetical protein PHLGIDRAFT_15089 [Phlebiopsis gigantea 11061_1 CR5-6]|uniref:t-SNARE coiled-coil homology domain-containing protein n=1 Tax=Phlebiopsis gigantea (strain 11061_1 CR5-6) TaxID=745531 RepID=A0A0C3S7C2_PHLG1|nr:hypothetical protein PHLGIDRAFT_15089 [Phlebiopsis gigantea 11061_1 CR5-6]
MSYAPEEQAVHDRINLLRLVKRLEKSVESEEWKEDTRIPSRAAWINTQGVLQNVELNYDLDESSSSTGRFDELRSILDRLDHVVQDVNVRVKPKLTRPSILANLPLPAASARHAPEAKVPPPLDSADLAAQDLLLSPSETLPMSSLPPDFSQALPEPSPLPLPSPAAVPSKSTDTSTSAPQPAFLQNSRALQEEMSAQLAAMATQLRRNAQHFASSLDADKAVVQAAQEKIERNHDVMQTERVRLRDHHTKSWGTTWITVLSMVVVVAGFLISFFVIRITR